MSNPLWVSFLAGSSTGMSVTLTLQPLDVIKTNIIGSQSAESRKMSVVLRRIYTSNGGYLGFWRGARVAMMRVFFAAGINFASLQLLLPDKGLLTKDRKKKGSMGKNALIGAASRGISCCCCAPFYVVKTLLEANQSAGIISTARNVIKNDGVRGLWSGIFPNLAKDLTYASLNIMFYLEMKTFLQERVSLAPSFAGAFSGFMSTAIAHPFEVIRTRSQLKRIHRGSINQGNIQFILGELQFMRSEFGEIFIKERLGFTRGLAPKLLKRTISNSLTFTLFEWFSHQLSSLQD